jgi:hypothetical protein
MISADIGNIKGSSSLVNQNSLPQSVITHVLTQCVSSHVLSGLCKITGYEILRHGTSWTSYKSLLTTGVDPKRGGETTELSTGKYETETSYKTLSDGTQKITVVKKLRTTKDSMASRAQGYFYVFRDRELGVAKNGGRALSRFLVPIGKRFGPVLHSYAAYVAQHEKSCEKEMSFIGKIVTVVKAIFTPKLKFIYSSEEINGTDGKKGIFENDPDYGEEAAYRTSQALPSDRIGMPGFFAHATKEHAWRHLKTNPGRVIQGIIQLAAGIFLTAIPGLGVIT